MGAYVALLRAVNVGGTGKLPMTDLVGMCERLGFQSVRTYIASGNAVFESESEEATVKARLEAALETYAGKPIGVLIRNAEEMAAIVSANPFSEEAPNTVVTLFCDTAPSAADIEAVTHRKNETLALGAREIYIHYPDGQGPSKLKIPAAAKGTARNMNTVAKLAAMAAEL